jgi:sporulation protein YlmC with PRC-barrel domain
MNVHVSVVVGKELRSRAKTIGKIERVFFAIETGKMTGVLTDKNEFFPAEHLFFTDDGTLTRQTEPIKICGDDWLGYQVVSADRERELGVVEDIEFDPMLFVITKLSVQSRVMGVKVPVVRTIYPFERIIDIKEKTIAIDDSNTENDQQGKLIPAMHCL